MGWLVALSIAVEVNADCMTSHVMMSYIYRGKKASQQTPRVSVYILTQSHKDDTI